MEKLVSFISNYYYLILIITIVLILAIIGYVRNNFFKKDFEVKKSYKDIDTDLEKIEVGENKSLGELLNKPSDLDKLNME